MESQCCLCSNSIGESDHKSRLRHSDPIAIQSHTISRPVRSVELFAHLENNRNPRKAARNPDHTAACPPFDSAESEANPIPVATIDHNALARDQCADPVKAIPRPRMDA